MKVRFYTFSKKYNSTARPSGTYAEYECVIKSSSDVITPTIELQMGLSTNPSAYNYCYIGDYGRYYWVKDWTFFNHLWIATLNVDVLATWKSYIGDTSMYVYRASAQYDGSLYDTKYPTKADITVSKIGITALGKKFSDGYFVLGVYGDSNNATTMAYYVIRASDFGTFMQELYSKGVGDSSIWNSLGTGIRNAIFDISSYIKSLMWFPADPSQLNTSSNTIKVGALTLNCPNSKIADNQYGYAISLGTGMISIPKHPQAGTRGSYCNIAPYSRYKLVYLPFGSFELDSTLVGLYTYLYCNVYVDAITGQAILDVYLTNDNQGAGSILILTRTCKYGVDIPIAVSQTNVPSIASSLAGAGISATHGNIFSAVVSAISSVAEMRLPALDSVDNSQGSLVALDHISNCLLGFFYTLADEDNNSNGRPLCKVKKPSVLGGYIEGESNDFSAPATIDEMEEIKRFIDNGFYYE